ncbi:DegV family protein [Thermosediminibacter litoriperuensis]|uniref:DegV family protein with EDD domain n=1 Tax=Thermosediminibacter litoriperuensis TaxID=291989 RepID=A0A5S5AST4_9FIRM|nr:DegV family protein [Thermosediminibacter litoriperuensis]TYP55504.1 DegV family protein with EDD domain [Thermosediminibacter litoriperuensis]
MAGAVIITDTSSDLPEDIIKGLPVKVLPMPVALKDDPEKDISHLSIKEFYDLMRRGEIMPTTSQVNAARFMECFKECLEQGQTPIVIGLSSRLTKSYEAALLARNSMPDADKIKIIDSKCASLGLGLVVLKAARMAAEGREADEIVKAVEPYAHHMEHIFTVDSLDHLKRGGRISAAQAFVGGLLNIKPILHFVDGAIHPLEKVRGRKNAVRRMLEIMEERAKDVENQVVGISHADDEEMALELAQAVKQRFNPREIVISWIGPVIGAHAGPGTLALFFQNA